MQPRLHSRRLRDVPESYFVSWIVIDVMAATSVMDPPYVHANIMSMDAAIARG